METKTRPDDKPPQHTIGMPDLQFMEVNFLKPTTKGTKAQSHNTGQEQKGVKIAAD